MTGNKCVRLFNLQQLIPENDPEKSNTLNLNCFYLLFLKINCKIIFIYNYNMNKMQ